jgi:WD40 repeat protein
LRLLDASTLSLRWAAAIPAEARQHNEQRIACFSPDGTLVATAHGPRVLVWEVGTDAPKADLMFPGPWGYVMAAIHPSNHRIVLSGREARMSVRDLVTGAVICDVPRTRSYSGVEFSPDGTWLAAASKEGPVFFDAAMNEAAPQGARGAAMGSFWPIRVSPDGSMAAMPRENDILLVSMPGGVVQRTLRGHTQNITALAFSSDGRRLASVGWDRAVRVWDLREGIEIGALIGHTGTPLSVGFVDGDRRIVTSSLDGTMRLWDASGSPGTLPVDTTNVTLSLSFAAGGSMLMVSAVNGIRLLDLGNEGASILPAALPLDTVVAGAISPDGRLVAVTRRDRSISTWDRESGRPVWTAHGHDEVVKDIAFSPDARLVASSAEDFTLRLWDTGSGAARSVFPRDLQQSFPPAFSPDSRLVACPSLHGVMIWNTRSGQTVTQLPQPDPEGRVNAVVFSPDGRLLATGDAGGTVTIWDAASFRPLRSIGGMQPNVWSLAFNPACTRLAAGSQDRSIRICDVTAGEEMLILRGHSGSVMSLAWSPDGRTLVSGSYDNTVRRWSAPPLPLKP